MAKSNLTTLERFESGFIAGKESECWIWKKALFGGRYGAFTNQFSKTIGAHRASWELYVGKIPIGLCVLHKCDVMQCVNPRHLFLGTLGDNNTDRFLKGRNADRKGAMHHMAKLTAAQVIEIRKSAKSNAALSKELGVCKATVRAARKGKNWSHL